MIGRARHARRAFWPVRAPSSSFALRRALPANALMRVKFASDMVQCTTGSEAGSQDGARENWAADAEIAPGQNRLRPDNFRAPNRNGGRHCCQPPLRRARICRCSQPDQPKLHRLSILTHQLRRRFPSQRPVRASLSQTSLPERSSTWVRSCLARRRSNSDVPRPFLG